LSPLLFAVYLDDIPITRSLTPRSFIILYADDILLIAPSIGELQRLFINCERECSVIHAKQSFHRSTNAIFVKIGRIASKEVVFQLVNCKCMPVLLYGLECFSVAKHVRSLDFAVTRFFMKFFRSCNINVINDNRCFF